MPRSPKLRKRFVGWLSRGLIRTFERWMRRKDALQAEKVGVRIGRLLFRVSKKHRERAIANLALAFPDLNSEERRVIAQKSFEHFGIVAMDFLRTAGRTDEEVARAMEIEGAENAYRAIEQGKGVLIISGHFGNWERVAQYSKLNGHEVYAVARDADDAQVQDEILRLREASGLKMISRGNAAKQIISLLRSNHLVALLPDQNCSESFLPFFGLPTGTVLGPATLSVRTGAPMIPMFCARIGPGRYKTHIFPALQPKEGVDGTILALSHSMNEALERIIRMYPEQWLWFHDRWKSARRKGLL